MFCICSAIFSCSSYIQSEKCWSSSLFDRKSVSVATCTCIVATQIQCIYCTVMGETGIKCWKFKINNTNICTCMYCTYMYMYIIMYVYTLYMQLATLCTYTCRYHNYNHLHVHVYKTLQKKETGKKQNIHSYKACTSNIKCFYMYSMCIYMYVHEDSIQQDKPTRTCITGHYFYLFSKLKDSK